MIYLNNVNKIDFFIKNKAWPLKEKFKNSNKQQQQQQASKQKAG